MPRNHLSILAAAALLALAACQENKEAPATNEPSEAPTPQATTPGSETASGVPDAPPSAISDPASPPPVGTDVGTVGQDATATVEAGDSTQVRAAHP